MNLGSISDQLPAYPNNIQGELRLILQTKDVFLVCYKHLEEYRRLVNEQNRLITKEFVQEQLQIGEDEISELKMELQDAENKLSGRLRHNELLAEQLASLGFASLETGGSARHMALCRGPQMRKNMLAQRQGGLGCNVGEPRPPTHMIDNIALAIAEIHQEVRSKVKPLLDYYRDLFYLQLHFTLVLGQVCNYCMPLVTENIGLIDRIFFWSERPEFDLVRRSGDIGDRLKEIYTRAQTVLGVLAESVRFLQSKVELQKTLEQRFHERLDEQQKTKDKILRDVHTTKQNMDLLEEENDRLVGSLVKVDPSFVDSRHFYELAEGGSLLGAKKGENFNESDQNNAEDVVDMMNSSSPNPKKFGTAASLERNIQRAKSKRRSRETASPSCLENPTDEMNNNKALSVAGEVPTQQVENKLRTKKKNINQEEIDALLKDIKSKLANTKVRAKQSPKTENRNNGAKVSTPVSSLGDGGLTQQNSSTPIPKQVTRREGSRTRSKSRNRGANVDRSPSIERKPKAKRRATSVERQPREITTKKMRSKSTLGERKVKERPENARLSRNQRTKTPEKTVEPPKSTTVSTASGDSTGQQIAQANSLKSKLLGRTRDILEAALHRSPKNSVTEQVTRSVSELDTSLAAGHLDHDDSNNDAVTSVSSFASLLIPDSPLGDPGAVNTSNMISSRQLRTLEPKKLSRHSAELEKQPKKYRSRFRKHIAEFESLQKQQQQALPALSTDALLTENQNDVKISPLNHTFDLSSPGSTQSTQRKSKRGKDRTRGADIGDFLTGTSLGPLPSASSQSSLPTLS